MHSNVSNCFIRILTPKNRKCHRHIEPISLLALFIHVQPYTYHYYHCSRNGMTLPHYFHSPT